MLDQLDAPTVEDLIRQRRLVYVRRLALVAPAALRGLLLEQADAKDSFVKTVIGDVEWLLNLDPCLSAAFAAHECDLPVASDRCDCESRTFVKIFGVQTGYL